MNNQNYQINQIEFKKNLKKIIDQNEVLVLSDAINLQIELSIEISNFVRKKLDNFQEDQDDNEDQIKQEEYIKTYSHPINPTPFDEEFLEPLVPLEPLEPLEPIKAISSNTSIEIENTPTPSMVDGIAILKYPDTNVIIRMKYYDDAIFHFNNVPDKVQFLCPVEKILTDLKNAELTPNKYPDKKIDIVNRLMGSIEESRILNGDFIITEEEYNFLNDIETELLTMKDEESELEKESEEKIPESKDIEDNEQNNKIYIISLPSGRYAMTGYQFEHQRYAKEYGGNLFIIDEIDLEEWTTEHMDNLNKYPELRDKLVLDKLKYSDFLILEGLQKIDTKEDPFTEEKLKKVQKPVFNLTPHQQEKFDGLIQKIDEILTLQKSISRPPIPAYYMATLEGAAGTGKTTMMKKVLEELLNKGLNIVFCSPTHQALGVIRETLKETSLNFTEANDEFLLGDSYLILKTLASFLGIKMNRDLESGKESFKPDPRAPQISCDILAVDESSMISKDQLRIIIQKLHINVKCILFIGDEVQLDSPADNNESNGIFGLPQKYSLEEVVRQAADNKILQLAWKIREAIKTKQCNLPPSLLLNPEITNENIKIFKNQPDFLQAYFQDEVDNKLISTYTNKITDEYNLYIRQMKLIGQGGKPLNIIIDPENPERKTLISWNEYKEFFIGEELVALEPNQKNSDVIHQTGERFIIQSIEEKSYSLTIQVSSNTLDLYSQPEIKDYTIRYYSIKDENNKTINVIRQEDQELYQEILLNLSIEAEKSTKKRPWSKYWSFKERFAKVNKTFAFTLHKLQGSTCENIYIDARDLDKFFKLIPIGVYKLIYIALTRPKQTVSFLI